SLGEGVMGDWRQYFSFRGRVGRARFWAMAISLWLITAVGSVFTMMVARILPLIALIFFPLVLAFIVATLANTVRRLHDRGKSAWWLLVFVVVPTLLSLPGEMAKESADEGVQMLGAACALLSVPFSFWGLIEMGFLR